MKLLITVSLALLPIVLTAQKKVASLPFEFEKKLLANEDYDAYFLDNQTNQVVSLILKDNRKVEYIQLDKNFTVLSKIDVDLGSTVFNEDIGDYRGGTAYGNVFNFIYQEKDKRGNKFQLETVDYNTKKVTHRSLFEIPKSETVISSFSDNNAYFAITADDKAKELVFYTVNGTGVTTQKRIPFTVPGTGRKQDKLSEYLEDLRFFKTGEEADLSSAVSSAKIFSTPGSLTFIINKEEQPVHLFSIQLPDLSVKEHFIDLHTFRKDAKEKYQYNSFKKKDLLFSLIVSKKNIQVVVHKAATGELVGRQEINEESNFSVFAQNPVIENRRPKFAIKTSPEKKEIDEMKRMLGIINQNIDGIMVTENNKGENIVTIGTHKLIPMGGSSGGFGGGFAPTVTPTTPTAYNSGATSTTVIAYNNHLYYRPGNPSYTNARSYTAIYFKLLLDSTATKYAKGKAPVSVPDQIKDYIQGAESMSQRATNQFSIGERQFYGYYDKNAKAYIIEEIQLKN